MKIVLDKLLNHSSFGELKFIATQNIFITGLRGSLDAFVLYEILQHCSGIIYISDDASALFRLRDDINTISGTDTAVIYISHYTDQFDDEISPLTVLMQKSISDNKSVFLLSPGALYDKVISVNSFYSNIIRLTTGLETEQPDLISRLSEYGFIRKNIVEEMNDFAIRGGIVDIFPETLANPVRIEFYGNRIESIRHFDLTTQRSIAKISDVEIIPPEAWIKSRNNEGLLLDYFHNNYVCIINEPDKITETNPDIFSLTSDFQVSFTSSLPLVKTRSLAGIFSDNLKEINFSAKSQPLFSGNLKQLIDNLNRLTSESYHVFITCSDEYQKNKTRELIQEMDENNRLNKIIYTGKSVHNGFILPSAGVALYTEHEIFNRYFRAHRRAKAGGISFRDLESINYGDFMVHSKYGIGKYAGLKKISTAGVEQEAVKLIYRDGDVVFVNINSLHELKKFSAQEGVVPKLTKLGTNQWEKIKKRTRDKIQEIAKDLILLYAKRKSSPGFAFSPDTLWQKELEASFIYEDTPDQISATDAVKKDMESPNPMDRLICGDVGFGKTEVAIRAAFKAVMDNKQVAMLVPTTILAEQHYNTFHDRLSNWAVEVDHLSRFRSPGELKNILKRLEEGKINIIIGTHRLLSEDVKFKDLGLLIIDEEQRFGVKDKEKIKMMKGNIDVLTLTATPIPRTLNFSLLGARDLSVMNTPPKNRQPIHTEIINFDTGIICDSITREILRGGQVYFVSDRISELENLAELIKENVKIARPAIAHGRMKSSELEKVMHNFLEKKTNVLVCTKIIESGLDIPSVNTIIINHAENFGLAELYQLRGRVGRSNIKSYAYLITSPHSSLTKAAVRRLQALEEFTELGSGINLALRDMEIRGTGNLLGAEQSGFIAELGFDTYMQILEEAVEEIKESDLGKSISEFIPSLKSDSRQPSGMLIESDIPSYIPDTYISDENTRLEIYNKISLTQTQDDLRQIQDELTDRFGKIPEETLALLKTVQIKILLSVYRFSKLAINGHSLKLYIDFGERNSSRDEMLQKLLTFINDHFSNSSRIVQTRKNLIIEFYLNTKISRMPQIISIADGLSKLLNINY